MTDVKVRREPLTYNPLSRNSFFADLLMAEAGDDDAEARLLRHRREMAVEQAAARYDDDARFARAVDGLGLEVRTNPNSTLGSGGEFTPPLWLIDHFATAARAGRTLGDLLNPVPLPPGVSSVHTPKIVVGSSEVVQAGNGQPVASVDITTSDVSGNVVTIAGEMDVSQQLFDLTPIGFDQAAFVDLSRDYNAKLEVQLLAGSGSAVGQLLGLNNFTIPAANSVDGSGATTLTLLWPLLGKAAANVGNNRLLAPEVYLMAPRRWFWMASSLDTSQRPIVSPGGASFHVGAEGKAPPAGGMEPFGPVHGLATYLDGAIPAGANPDNVYAVRPSDMYLFESAPKVMVMADTLSGTLQVRLRWYRYVAFVGNQYSSGLGVVTAIPQPAGF